MGNLLTVVSISLGGGQSHWLDGIGSEGHHDGMETPSVQLAI